MADRFVISHLKRLPLFARLTPDQLETVANAVQVLRYEPRETIFTQGQPAAGLIIFVSGRGSLAQTGPDNVERSVGSVNSGEYLNEAALFQDVIAPVTLHVWETSIVLLLSRQQMTGLLTYHPDIAAALRTQATASTSAAQPPVTPPVAAAPSQPKVFPGQRDNETVIIQTRRHWWAFARRVWLTALIALILIFGVGLLQNATVFALVLPLILLAVGISVYFYLEWRNDLFIVTDQRIVSIRREIISFSTHFNEIPLLGIQELNVVIPPTDPMARLFNYGNLAVRTTSHVTNLVIDFLPNAKGIQEIVFTQQKGIKDRQAEQVRSMTRNAIRSDVDKFLGRTPGVPDDVEPIAVMPPGIGSRGFLNTRYLNEKGETVYRKHWIVWLRHIFFPALILLVGIGLVFGALLGMVNLPDLGFIGLALAFVVILIGVVWLYLADWDWRNDLYIIGNQTITLIHRRPLWLQNQNDQILLSQVDNVVSELKGFISNLLQVGDVGLFLTGADAKDAKWFRTVHHPQDIQQEVSRRQDQARLQRQEEEAGRERQQILDYLAVYHESVGGGGAAPDTPTASAAPPAPANPAGEQPPRVRDRSRPPGIPLVRRDNPPDNGG